MGVFASCHPLHSQKNRTALSAEDSLLAQQYPLPEHLLAQKDLLLKLSKRAKGITPDGKHFEGNFNSGAIELVLDEIDGEPSYFFGHLEEADPQGQLEFIVYGISNEKLDQLVPGKKYRVHWMETVVNLQPYDDDRYRYFMAYRIDE
jgi:hypothetical protein